MKVGFIGCGNMGSALAAAIAENKEIKLSVFDTDTAKAEALAKYLFSASCIASKTSAHIGIVAA